MMLKHSNVRCMKPYLHVFSPGRTAAEKGSLYRNNNQNAHARLANMQAVQRTWREDRKFKFLMLPEQSFYGVILVCFGVVSLVMSYRNMPMTAQFHRDKWIQGGASTHERFVRRDEMALIFEAHREAVEGTRAEVPQPEIFSPPAGSRYKSHSGAFA